MWVKVVPQNVGKRLVSIEISVLMFRNYIVLRLTGSYHTDYTAKHCYRLTDEFYVGADHGVFLVLPSHCPSVRFVTFIIFYASK